MVERHDLTRCERQGKRRYHNCVHSDEFLCPSCGRTGRFQLNRLGAHRAVFCEGVFRVRRVEEIQPR